MRVPDEIVDKLQALKGMNLDVAYRIFRDNKLDVKRVGFVENVIALLIDRELPKNFRGMDFRNTFEVKEVKVKFTKKRLNSVGSLMRTGGDTPISAFIKSEVDFFESNIWDKTNSVLLAFVDEHRLIVDVRFFDGESYADVMKKDYDKIIKLKNLCRKENEILVFKTGRNSIMLKGQTAIEKSVSILNDEPVDIPNQTEYINELFDAKFASYQEKIKSIIESITALMERVTVSELEAIRKLADKKIIESMGFDLSAGSELKF